MVLFEKWREKRRREKSAKKGQSSNLWEKLFKKRRAKKKYDKPGTMGKPEVNMWGEPINQNYPKKTKQIIKNITTNKYDEIARRKYNKDYKDLNKLQQKSVRRRSRKMAKRSLFGKNSIKRKSSWLGKKRKRKIQ